MEWSEHKNVENTAWPFPFYNEVCEIIYPEKPRFILTITLDMKDYNIFVRTLFAKKFNIIAMSINGIYQVYKMKTNIVTIWDNFDTTYKIEFNGTAEVFRQLSETIEFH
jgi:hypothetical protein